MKEGLRGKHYASDEEVKTVVIKWLKEHVHIWSWNIAIERNGNYVKK